MRMSLYNRLKLTLINLLLIAGARAQVCNTNGNLIIFTNYDGGNLNINVDQNIPNLKIGICSYEACAVTISGAFAGNVTAVRYAGYNDPNNLSCGGGSIATSVINGATNTSTTIVVAPTATLSNSNGYGSIICGYSCNNNTNQGGCNTVDQVEAYFLGYFTGSVLLAHRVQYNCWSGTYSVSAGGNCCPVVPVQPGSVIGTQTLCAGSTPAAFQSSVAASGGSGPITYTWQSSTTSALTGFSNINGANAATYAPSSLPVTTWFRRAASTGTNAAAFSNVLAVTVNPLPNFLISGPSSHCDGNLLNMSISLPGTYTWFPGGIIGSSVSISFTASTVYTIAGTDANGCTNTKNKFVQWLPTPTIAVSASKQNICSGETVTVTASGASSYIVQPGGVNPSVVNSWTFQPNTTTTYSFGGLHTSGCSDDVILTLTVNPRPEVNLSGDSDTLCIGDTLHLQASGGTLYSWSANSSSLNSAAYMVAASQTISVIGYDNNSCADTAFFKVTALNNPVLTVKIGRIKICRGENTSITVTGAPVYSWSSSNSGSVAVVSPTATADYTITGTDNNGCSTSIVQTLSVSTCLGFDGKNTVTTDMRIYPNPNSGSCMVRSSSVTKVILFNSLGQMVQTFSLEASNDFTYTLRDLSEGVYFLETEIKGQKSAQKIIVQGR